MRRYNQIMTAVCLTLGAVLMTAVLVGGIVAATAVGSIMHNLAHRDTTTSFPGMTTDAPKADNVEPDTTQYPTPSASAEAACDAAKMKSLKGDPSGDAEWKALNCSQYGGG